MVETQKGVGGENWCSAGTRYGGVENAGEDGPLECGQGVRFESIENEDQIKDLTGTSFNTFNLLLGFLPTVTTKSVLNEKNSLLLFLIKIKLGITFSALSVFFKINRRTVPRIFFKTLHSCLL